jgi:hypothetical protein
MIAGRNIKGKNIPDARSLSHGSAFSRSTLMPPFDEAPSPPLSGVGRALGRLGRLARKELREILRDRRTIVTLVLMPLLVYPLLAIAFQRFLLTTLRPDDEDVIYRVAVESEEAARLILPYLHRGDFLVTEGTELKAPEDRGDPPEGRGLPLMLNQHDDLEAAVASFEGTPRITTEDRACSLGLCPDAIVVIDSLFSCSACRKRRRRHRR